MIDRVFEELKVPRQIRIEVGQSETAYSFVASRAGVAVVDPISAFTNRDARTAVRRFEPAVEFDVWLIRPKVARPFNLIDRFTAFALERLADFVANELSARPLEGAPVSG